MFGELVPLGGGDPIPLLKKRLRVGRRDSNDIMLDFGNVSGYHCLMEIEEGYWFIKDLRSRNGVKVAGKKLMPNFRKRIDPKVVVTIAKHQFELHYDPADLGAYGTPPQDDQIEEILNESLLERAGLKKNDKK